MRGKVGNDDCSLSQCFGCAVVLGCATSLARADDKDQIKQSIKTLAIAMKDGDGATAKKYVVNDENSQKLIDMLAKIAKASKDMQDAAVAKFGDEGKTLVTGRMTSNAPHFDKDLDEANITINGDTATVAPKDPTKGSEATFKKQDGTWKLDLQSMPHAEQMAQGAVMMGKMADVMTEMTGEIKDGKYSSAPEARQAFYQKVGAAMGGGRPPGGRPPG